MFFIAIIVIFYHGTYKILEMAIQYKNLEYRNTFENKNVYFIREEPYRYQLMYMGK